MFCDGAFRLGFGFKRLQNVKAGHVATHCHVYHALFGLKRKLKQVKIWLLQLTNDAFVLPAVFVVASAG